ncbi:MAG: MaoC/PaaZ C-terminal domain-containing protein [Alphaproteobacteria bacterium]|mgnify:CR=1 FL=1|jgi:acyl dehydratase|nr:MaoC/PaaZ C-terminal domain-containing protein [Alphaproteobacteria bacterium]MDP6815516.1 MaoC/PaaZ C-terminal domain-containing protein [Alphaproteobacteria bacterium]
MAANLIYYNDLKVGDALAADGLEVTVDEIVRFGRRYDPRPYHVDEEAATASIFGGLVASGAQTLAFWNYLRFKAEEGLAQLATLSLDNIHYLAPVRPGDHLRLEAELTSARRSMRKPDRGIMTFRHNLYNQANTPVINLDACLLVARRPAE